MIWYGRFAKRHPVAGRDGGFVEAPSKVLSGTHQIRCSASLKRCPLLLFYLLCCHDPNAYT